MYSLIVVDDENAIRKGICEYIDWNAMGFEVAASFEDGRETLEYLENHHADVVLTDIEMAEVSGLELARRIFAGKMNTRVVIISGYKEFEYARRAIEYGVEYYLLKPVKLDEVASVFGRLKTQLDRRYESEAKSSSEQERFIKLLPELREQFWASLPAMESMTGETLKRRLELLRLDVSVSAPCALLSVGFDSSETGPELAKKVFAIGGAAVDFFSGSVSGDALSLIAVAKDGCADFERSLNEAVQEKQSAARGLFKADFTVKTEGVFSSICELAGSSVSMKKTGGAAKDGPELTAEQLEMLEGAYRSVISAVDGGDFERLESQFAEIAAELCALPVSKLRQLCVDTLSAATNKLMRMQTDVKRLLADSGGYEELLKTGEAGRLAELMSELLRQLAALASEKRSADTRELIEQAAKYIKEHCSEDVSLELAANRCHLNPAYFSRLYKQYTGDTFTDSLIKFRMEKAKELLKTGRYKVYEVSRMVGYRSEKYFFRVFRHYAGCSPAEFYRSGK